MSIADLIYEKARNLPDDLAREVLDFVGYLTQSRERAAERNLRDAQEAGLKAAWDNPEDQAWDRV